MEAVEADPEGRDGVLEQEVRTTCRRRFLRNSELWDHLSPLWKVCEPSRQHGYSARAELPWSSQKGDWRSATSSGISSSGADGVDAPPGLELTLGRIDSAVEKPCRRSLTAASGLQGAHAESADDFDALLDDAQNAGLSGVDRLNGASLIAKVIKTRECRPDVVTESHSRRVKQQLRVLPVEAWSISRCHDQMVQGDCGNFQTLRRMLAAVAWIMEEHRTSSAERAMVMTNHLYLVLEAAAADLEWAWPLLGVADPEGRHNMHLFSLEQSDLISFHQETAAYEEAKRRLTSAASTVTRRHQGCRVRSRLAFEAN